jgi:aminopeptidase N
LPFISSSAYSNAGQDNLWAALQTQADLENVVLPATIKEIMDTWTYKMGFPFITVTRDYQTGGALVTQVCQMRKDIILKKTNKLIKSINPQERFLLRKSNDSTDPIVYQWWVPLTYTSDYTQTTKRDWLPVDQVSKTLSNLGASANQWVIFNIDQQS